MTQQKKATLLNAITREHFLWEEINNEKRKASYKQLLRNTNKDNLLESLYDFFKVDNYEKNTTNTEQKSDIMDTVLELMGETEPCPQYRLHLALSSYVMPPTEKAEKVSLSKLSNKLTLLTLHLVVRDILETLDKDTKSIADQLEDACIPYFTGWLGRHAHNVHSLGNILEVGDTNEKTKKMRLNKVAMKAIMDYYIEEMGEVRALYAVNINIIDFDVFTNAFSRILSALYDDVTNDYISTFLYEYDCCREKILEITWEDGGFTISDSDSLVDYLDKYVYSVVL